MSKNISPSQKKESKRFDVYLGDIFIRKLEMKVRMDFSWRKTEERAKRKLAELYPNTHQQLTLVRHLTYFQECNMNNKPYLSKKEITS
jgi:hypothetical protein